MREGFYEIMRGMASWKMRVMGGLGMKGAGVES